MKNLVLLFLFITAVAVSSSYGGNIVIGDFIDSTGADCPAPINKQLLIFGTASGYNTHDSVSIQFFFGNGTDSTVYFPIWQGTFFGHINHTYNSPGFYTVKAIVTGPDGVKDSSTMAYPLIVSNDCGNIKGRVYVDYNNDCIYNTGDLPLVHYKVYLKQGAQVIKIMHTDADGEYAFSVPSGNTYELEVEQLNGASITCPASGSYTVSSFPAHNQDFALSCSATGFDLYAITGSGFVVPGIRRPIYMQVRNASCNLTSGVARVILSDSRIGLSANQANATVPDSTSGDTLYYSFADVDLFNHYTFNFYVTGDTTLQIGDTICIDLQMTPVAGDLDPVNNNISFCYGVRTSYDPNMKEVYPMGSGIDGRVRPNTDLTYTVHFQNTGNFMASNVFILDTIDDQNLDFSSLEILEYSHPMELYVIDDKVLKFTFNDIMLPDSNSNEPMSHGYVTYTIKQKQNLSTGTVIHNTAAIYFDYNPPIITNTTVTTIDATLNVEEIEKIQQLRMFNAYPNPAGDMVNLKLAGHIEKGQVYLVDITGKVVLKDEIEREKQLSVKHLPNGLYNIIIRSGNEVSHQKLIILH